ncbi:hypothetical protein CBS101457_001230 [Exobasidium rhododendri]|nr:hypothetical protein CBS101457_001230 [Exobasidium rhododendri]
MSVNATPLLITPQRLASLLSQAASRGQENGIRVLDATWFMPNVKRDALQEFTRGPRLPRSTFWDVESVASLKDEVDINGHSLNPLGLGHMMPSPEKFAKAASSQGISNDTHVVIYDTLGIFSSPRTAFTFHAFRHGRISILDGGLPGWLAEGLPTESGDSSVQKFDPVEYNVSSLRSGIIRSYDEMMANARMKSRGQTVLDARPRERFTGEALEPRPGLSSGHIPSSTTLPFSTLLDTHPHPTDPETTFTTLKSQTDLWRTLSDSLGGMEKLDSLRQASSAGELAATNTCGSGMTAAVIWLSLNQLGIESAIYDESWTGYAQRKTSVIDQGEGD